jgi:hypothetical protein
MRPIYFTGLKEVEAKLQRELNRIRGKTRRGVTVAALEVKKRSLELTPVDTGNLRQSAYTRSYGFLTEVGAEIGYTASYAVFVHEVKAAHRTGQWKFLETALRQLKGRILEILTKFARV